MVLKLCLDWNLYLSAEHGVNFNNKTTKRMVIQLGG